MKHAAGLLLLVLLLPSLGCDKATPVAPGGTILTLSANPTKIGLNGSSTITVVGRRPDGNPLNPGTEIRLTADKGTIQSVVAVDDRGQATATLRADGRSGPAIVKASAGDANVETTVQIGESTETKPSLLLSISPNSIETEKTAIITIIARNADGSPAPAGQIIILTTTLGKVSPSRPTTRNDGTATATFTAEKLAGSATITAVMGSSEAATTTITIRDIATNMTLSANPASVAQAGTPADTPIKITALVINAQQQALPNIPVSFSSPVGTLSATIRSTDSSGTATVDLVITAAQIQATGSDKSFEVTASAPGAGGDFIERKVKITIQGR